MNTYHRYIYDIKKTMQSILCYIISMQCSLHLSQISINTNSTLLGSSSSPTITPMETASDIILKSTVTADTT